MATKINQLKQKYPPDTLLLSPMLREQGVSRGNVRDYEASGWLVSLANGVYRFGDGQPTLYSALSSFQRVNPAVCHIGASTSLELHGFSHFVTMGKPKAILFHKRGLSLPVWLTTGDWDMSLVPSTSDVFGDIGIETVESGNARLRVSSLERAIMECLLLSPKHYALIDVYYLMEMLTTLRPKLITELLQRCSSVKVKRLFLYMAEKAGHAWFKRLDLDGVELGSGPRSLEKGGVKIAKYNIVIPKELADYE